MKTTIWKYTTIEIAKTALLKISKKEPGIFYLIESNKFFYVDKNGFCRTWETIHFAAQNGKLI